MESRRKNCCSCSCLCCVVFFIYIAGLIWSSGDGVSLGSDPYIILGEWISASGEEYMNITHKETIVTDKTTTYCYEVQARGCKIFRTDSDDPKNYYPKIKTTGTIRYEVWYGGLDNDSFQIEWKNVEGKYMNQSTVFMIMLDGMFRTRLFLYTYWTDPDMPRSMVRLYKVKRI